MDRRRRRSVGVVAVEPDNDVLRTLLARFMDWDAEGDPLRAVRRNIPRPRFRVL